MRCAVCLAAWLCCRSADPSSKRPCLCVVYALLPPPAGGDNVWAGWVPASGAEGETTAAEMRQKLRAKAGEGGGSEEAAAARAEARRAEEESVTRERTIGSGEVPAWAGRARAGSLPGGAGGQGGLLQAGSAAALQQAPLCMAWLWRVLGVAAA